jgi:arylsulfatase
MEQRLEGTMGVWAEPFVRLRLPKIYNLRTDPYEYASITSNTRTLSRSTTRWRR